MDSSDVGVRPGDLLAGKYRVERVLGRGGMGVVVAAHHIHLDERVALKFLLPEALKSPEAVSRFAREARAAVKIKNEHVARVTDVGQLDSGVPYMVMEYLEGGDLAGWLKQRGALPFDLAVDFVLQACEAIADAHVLGIVHRDLKPANLFCIQRSDGQLSIKVLDFGISKVTVRDASGNDMTRTSAIMGSPFYMSPEQMQHSKGVDARTDIWALGVILYELITAAVPFHAEAVTELAVKIVTEPATPMRALRHDVPPGLEQVVATCLEKDRARRFQTVGDLAIALKDHGPRSARASVERILGTLRQAGVSGAVLPPSGAFRVAPVSSPQLSQSAPHTGASWQTGATAQTGGKGILIGVGVTFGLAALATAGILVVRMPRPSSGGVDSLRPSSPMTSAALVPAVEPPQSVQLAPESTAPESSDSPPTVAVSALPAAHPPTLPPVPVATSPVGARVAPPPGPRPASFNCDQLLGEVDPRCPPRVARPPAKASCNPPYVIDAAGNRQYKPECL